MTTTEPANGLQRLINEKRGDRSYARLAQDCGGYPSASHLRKMATTPMTQFPGPEVVTHLARGLRVRAIDVILASAVSLGLPVSTQSSADLTIEGAGTLPAESQDAIRQVAENMLWWQEQAAAATPQGGEVVELRRPEWAGMAAFKRGEGDPDPEDTGADT